MSNREPDFWLRELARAGLSTNVQGELLASLALTAERRARYFPSPPLPYLARVRQLLMSAFFPRKGPLLISVDPSCPPERLSRSHAWQIVYWELPHLDGASRPVNELHMITSDVISMMARNEFPLTVPPRWLSDLFEVLGRAAELKMEANKWPMAPPSNLDPESEAYVAAVCKNIENEKRRCQRQQHTFRAGEDEIFLDAFGQPLPLLEGGPLIPQLPDVFPLCHKPRSWIPPPRISAPKREREGAASSADDEMKDPETKRRASATDRDDHDMDAPSDVPAPSAIAHGGQYGAAPQIWSGLRFCLREVARNPLRGYPSSIALYGMEPDGTLLTHTVFPTNFVAGGDSTRVFTRGESDPATSALAAIGADRVPAETIEMCTWDANKQTLEMCTWDVHLKCALEAIRPFSDKDDVFHVYKLPLRRVDVGSTKHMWSFGARPGPMASGH